MKHLLKNVARSAGYDIRRANVPVRRGGRTIHFLHIGKNAGTQVANIAEQVNRVSASHVIVPQRHGVLLRDLPYEDPYFFSIRCPISRFRSGFYSRKRKGQPRIYSEWTPHDAIAFSEFEHANDLAESLFAEGELGHKACAAINSIRHTAENQRDWFSCYGNFLTVRPPVWIVRQERFETDFKTFMSRAFPDIDASAIDFTIDNVASHKNDYTDTPPLSDRAIENLKHWYAQDIAFCGMCEDWIEAGGNG